jgi:ribosome maturation factor RimP
VYLDHREGVTLNDCVRMTPIISNALDAAEADPAAVEVGRLLNAPYTLEVSSPGLDRPLRRRSHFARFVGRKVKVQCSEPLDPESRQRTFHGRIEEVQSEPTPPGAEDDDRTGILVLRTEEGQQHAISLALIRRANLVYEGD